MLQIIAAMIPNLVILPILIIVFLVIEVIFLSIAIILNNLLLGNFNDTTVTSLITIFNTIFIAYIIFKARKSNL